MPDHRRPLILNAESDRYNPEAAAILRKVGRLVLASCNRHELKRQLADCDVLIVRLQHRVDRELLLAAPRLRVIAVATTGTDHIDTECAHRLGVEVLSLRGETAFLRRITATAELAWAILLMLVRRLGPASRDVTAGHWRRNSWRGNELKGKTLGIVGLGRLGAMVARYGIAFGMRILAHDPHRRTAPPGVRLVNLATLLGSSDVVSLHVPLRDDTRHLMNRGTFALLKPGAILVNTSRGGVVDDRAMLASLRSGRLAGAALDVIDAERGDRTDWLRTHPLRAYAALHSNLVLTPHIGGATCESMYATELFMAHKLARYIRKNRDRFRDQRGYPGVAPCAERRRNNR